MNDPRPDPVEVLKRLVATPSLSGEEAELAALVVELARSWQLPAEMAGRNVVIRLGPDGRPCLLLNSHLDTVSPAADWPHDPYSPVELDDRVSGLGANDAKGCVTAMLCAAAGLAGGELAGQLVLALTVDEEVGGADGLAWLVDRLGPLDAAVIGEPTGLDVCVAQKGLLVLELEAAGVARHAAHAHRLPGANAIVEAARAITALESWSPGIEDPLLGPVTCHVTTITGGSRRNVIPDRCRFALDIRTVADTSTEDLVREIRALTGAEVRVISDRMRPMATDPGATIVSAARRARPDAEIVGSATLSDAVWTRHLPTIKVGPGSTERSHTAGEYVTRTELEAGVVFYRRLIEGYFALHHES